MLNSTRSARLRSSPATSAARPRAIGCSTSVCHICNRRRVNAGIISPRITRCSSPSSPRTVRPNTGSNMLSASELENTSGLRNEATMSSYRKSENRGLSGSRLCAHDGKPNSADKSPAITGVVRRRSEKSGYGSSTAAAPSRTLSSANTSVRLAVVIAYSSPSKSSTSLPPGSGPFSAGIILIGPAKMQVTPPRRGSIARPVTERRRGDVFPTPGGPMTTISALATWACMRGRSCLLRRLCAFPEGRSRALPGVRPDTRSAKRRAEGGGRWGNHGFPHLDGGGGI